LIQFEETGVKAFYEVAFCGEVVLDGGFLSLGFDVLGCVFEAEEEGSRVFDIL
jgi:hypothetical protein